MDSILEFIGRLLLALLLLFVLLPVIWFVCSPFILTGALLVPGPYGQNVSRGFRSVSKAWIDWGILILP